MNRQWMYGDRHTFEYVKGTHNFLEVAEANKQNGFMCCPCPKCGNTKSYTDRKILTPTCFTRVSCHTIMFGRGIEK